MGCVGSRFDELPVTGHSTGFVVLSVKGKYYCTRPETTVLKLREKLLSFSWDDCSIKVNMSETVPLLPEAEDEQKRLKSHLCFSIYYTNYFNNKEILIIIGTSCI